MACSCRLSSLRLFVSSLAQIHNVVAPPLRPAAQTSISTFSRQATTARSFHATRIIQSEADSNRSGNHQVAITSSANATPAKAATDGEHHNARDQSANSIPRKSTTQNRDNKKKPKWNSAPPNLKTTSALANKSKFEGQDFLEPAEQPTQDTNVDWKTQKSALKDKFPEGWKPRKRLSPDALAGIRALNAQFPDVYTTEALATKFEVSPEAIRRILKSKWRASADEEEDRQERWFRRGKQVWERKAALGFKPPKKWRREGVGNDGLFSENKARRARKERDWEQAERDEYRNTLDRRRGGGGGSSGPATGETSGGGL